ncbi:hypothetical protein CBR_g40495 [Chara braunii]|uniref:Reverse transcriptase domain-containing protein n=1 Tax=Chara braunii TaxID=69332 RepID=A0A388LTW9_CHABU|nr:hypothetical protein CBR_g40495 [Chara braunii]|eukprot:GBG85766.1 hypothetical protein CBR_g40495 [Chara braunii]
MCIRDRAKAAEKLRLQADSDADAQARRKEAQDLLQRHEATSIDRLKFWHFEPNGDEATPEEKHKEFLSKLVSRLLYTCNYQQAELEKQPQELATPRRTVQSHEHATQALNARLLDLEQAVQSHEHATQALNARLLDLEQAVPGPTAGASSSAPSSRQLEEHVDHILAMLDDINTFTAPSTISTQLHTLKTEVQQLQSTNADGNQKMPTFQLEKFDDYTQQDPTFWWEAFTMQLRILIVAKHKYIGALLLNSKGGCQTWLTHLATSHDVDVPDLKDKITFEELTRLWKKRFIHQAQDLLVPRSGQGGCATPPQLKKLSSTEGEATPPSTPPDSTPLLAASCTSGEDANVASPRYTYEDYAVHLVPPLDQPLRVQQSTACTVSSPSATDSAASPQSVVGDSTSWSRFDELDLLTFTDFQWMPVPSTGRLPKPHCSVLMTQLRDYLHTAVPASLMDIGVEVVDLHVYIAKIDREFKTQREDHPMNFFNRTVHVRDRNGVLVPCTVPLPRPSISCHVVAAASMRASIIRDDIKEMGVCFLHALPPHDASSTDSPSDPCITELLDAYNNVFKGPHGVVPDRPIRHEIILEDGAVPPQGCIYRMSEEELSVLRAQLDDLLENGWIRPSSLPYGTPVLFVRKKNKDLRLCIDYRKLNAQTIRNADPLPRIDDLLERLGGAQFFLKLDLTSGYHQLELRKEDHYKTAFKTRYGYFEWLVMPFGLTNAPTTFQAAMTTEFRHMLDRYVLIYLDDILVYSRSLEEHVEHLRTVLERLRQAKYKADRDKCEFARQKLEYVGHYVTPQGIRPLADKIEALQVWPEPTNSTDVRSFMGLAGYYQRFITGYSRIAAPMTRLRLPKVPFVFDDDARRSFQALSIYVPTLPTRVTTNASGYGIGAVLEQHDGDD